MREVAGRFATAAALPLVFDSAEPEVMEAGLQLFGGKAILNSANLEEGEHVAHRRFQGIAFKAALLQHARDLVAALANALLLALERRVHPR